MFFEKFEDTFKELQKLWDDALVDAATTYKFADTSQEIKKASSERDEGKRQDRYEKYDKPITLDDVKLLRTIIAAHNGERVSINDFTSEDIQKAQKWAYKFYKTDKLGVKSPFFRALFGDWRAYDKENKEAVTIQTINISETSLPYGDYEVADTNWLVHAGKVLNDDTRHHTGGANINVKSLNAIKEILKNAVLLDTIVSEPDTNKKSPNTAFLHKLYTVIEYDGKKYLAKISIEEYYNETIKNVSQRAYNLKAIKIEPTGGQLGNKSSSSIPNIGSTYSISDLFALVKEYDKDFKPKEASVVRNADGTPKVMYHGTSRGGHNIFDPWCKARYGLFGAGTYFTDNKSVAEGYTKKGRGDNPQIYEVYLNLKNPMDMDAQANTKAWAKQIPDAIFPESGTNEDFYRAMERYFEDEMYVTWEAAESAMDAIIGMGYDGITHIGGGRFNKGDDTRHRVYIAFESEQIKSATDNIGTFDKAEGDIRYSSRYDKDIRLEEENKKLRRDIDKLKSYIWLQRTKTGGVLFTNSSVTKAAERIMKNANIHKDKDAFIEELHEY